MKIPHNITTRRAKLCLAADHDGTRGEEWTESNGYLGLLSREKNVWNTAVATCVKIVILCMYLKEKIDFDGWTLIDNSLYQSLNIQRLLF